MGKTYKERQAECGLKVGDKVKILRKAEHYEDGWGNTWAGAYMDDYVGRVGKIIGKRPGAGFLVFCEELDTMHQFPYFVLEKVEDEVTEKAKEPKSYKERQAECGLKVGDKVKILRKVADYEDGWDNDWIPRMSECVGGTGVIRGIFGALGVGVKTDNYGAYVFPYFALEKVEENETPKRVEPVKQEEKKLTRYSVFTMRDQGKDFFFIPATSKEETSESIILTEESGGTWEFYKKHIIAIKTI